MLFSVEDLANQYGASKRTMERRIAELKENCKFRKESSGKFFDEKEALKLSKLLNFTIKNLQT